jgi:hypothetical protein
MSGLYRKGGAQGKRQVRNFSRFGAQIQLDALRAKAPGERSRYDSKPFASGTKKPPFFTKMS